MRRITFWMGVAVIAAGCQQAPVTRPRILSVQTPAGVPPAAPLNTTRNNPLIVPTAPIGPRGAVVAPTMVAPIPTPPPGVIAQPAPIPVPAVPGAPVGVQGMSPPNTIAPGPAQYPATVITTAPAPGSASLKRPAPLPGPVSDSSETGHGADR